MKNKAVAQKGITLIILVVTIVVILILAGIAMNLAFNKNGIIERAKGLQEIINQSIGNEEYELEKLTNHLEESLLNAGIGGNPNINDIGGGEESEIPQKPKIKVSGTQGEENCYRSDVEIAVTANDRTDTLTYTIEEEIEHGSASAETGIENGESIHIQKDGTFTVTVYAYNRDEKKSEGMHVTITRDTVAPTGTLTVTKEEEDSITVQLLATDSEPSSGLASSNPYTMYYKENGTDTWIEAGKGASATYTYAGLTPNNSYDLKAEMTDKAGNIGTSNEQTNVQLEIKDDIKPTMDITSPEEGTMIKKGDTIEITIKPSEEVTINKDKILLTGEGSTSSILHITQEPDGTIHLMITGGEETGDLLIQIEEGFLTDKAGNISIAQTLPTYQIDNIPPIMTVSPASGAVASTRNVIVTISDRNAGLSSNNNLTYYLSTSNTNPIASGYQTGTYTSGTAFTIGTGLTGTYYLFLPVVADKVGNNSTATIDGYYRCGTYLFDNSAPNITSFTTSATSICDAFTVNISATDIGTAGLATTNTYTYYFSDNGGASYTSSTSTDTSQSYTELTGDSGTQYKAYVVVKDTVGNSQTSETLTMTVHDTQMPLNATGGTYDSTKKVNVPYLYSALNPVMWKGTEEIQKYCQHWQVTSEWTNNNGDNNWYQYTTGTGDHKKSRWANAIDADGSYYVWIPRYEYKITKGNPGTIAVNFIDKNTTTATSGYTIHPAFCTDVNKGGYGQELSGIWVAKYEACDVDSKPISKPNTSSWRNMSIGSMYTTAYSYNRNMDTHLMKNSEWRNSSIFDT